MKYDFLYIREYADIDELYKNFSNVVETMNILPRAVLYGLTSYEVFEGATPNKYQYCLQMAIAKAARKNTNLEFSCNDCKSLEKESNAIE